MNKQIKAVQLALALLTVGSVATSSPAADTRAAKPNIIFILFDDLGYGEPQSFRAESQFKTPNLDRLAREGMRFTYAHCAASNCTPTRYGVITGRYPWRIGRIFVLNHDSPPIIGPDRMTVAGMLKAQDYHTACFGKWHLGMNITGDKVANGPLARGFDRFCGYTEARSISKVFENDQLLGTFKEIEAAPLIARKTVAYIDERAKAGQPFFIYVPLSQPHIPHIPSPEFQGKSGQQTYGDWIMQGDGVVGQILDALDRHQLATNTLVLVSSDNGAHGRAYPPLRGSKGSIYEGGHRVPFFARWPGKVKSGSTCDDTICLNDLMATCADLVGVKLPENAAEDSVSILPDLLGTAAGPVREATVHQSGYDLAIRQGPWKLVFLAKGANAGATELYNLATDLSETTDVAGNNPEVVARLTNLFQHYIDTGRSTPGAPQKNGVAISLTGRRYPARSPRRTRVGANDKGTAFCHCLSQPRNHQQRSVKENHETKQQHLHLHRQ